jgi:hypothetical protein
MPARVGAIVAWIVLALALIAASLLDQKWNAEQEQRSAEQHRSLQALAAQLERQSKKIDRLELSLMAARAEAAAARARNSASDEEDAGVNGQPDADPSSVAPIAAPVEAMPPENDETFAAASQVLDGALRRGHWSAADGARLEALLPELNGELRHRTLARLSQEVNAGRLIPELGAFPL